MFPTFVHRNSPRNPAVGQICAGLITLYDAKVLPGVMQLKAYSCGPGYCELTGYFYGIKDIL